MNARRSLGVVCVTIGLSFAGGVNAGGLPDRLRCDATDSAANLRAEPATIPIGLMYDGSEVRLTAEVPPGMSVAIVLEGKYAPLELKKKGKVWGVLWMSVGDLAYDEVPDAYLLATSAPLRELADEATLARVGIGYPALAAAAGGDTALFGEVIKLQEQGGLFYQSEGTVKQRPDAERTLLGARLPIHAHVPPGEYNIRLVGFDRGVPRCLGSTSVKLEPVGAAKQLRALAMERGLFYGITAVIVALVAGLATGLVFGKGASKAH